MYVSKKVYEPSQTNSEYHYDYGSEKVAIIPSWRDKEMFLGTGIFRAAF